MELKSVTIRNFKALQDILNLPPELRQTVKTQSAVH